MLGCLGVFENMRGHFKTLQNRSQESGSLGSFGKGEDWLLALFVNLLMGGLVEGRETFRKVKNSFAGEVFICCFDKQETSEREGVGSRSRLRVNTCSWKVFSLLFCSSE